jgi:hypothetical protein
VLQTKRIVSVRVALRSRRGPATACVRQK